MAKHLGLNVVAEGVELEEQLEFLKRHRCGQLQGFLYSKAVPAREFRQLILDSSDLAMGS
jgi:EAL domain-containing protein (putative c-di-GMP-specific phosphodiesterase class I)